MVGWLYGEQVRRWAVWMLCEGAGFKVLARVLRVPTAITIEWVRGVSYPRRGIGHGRRQEEDL